jgi:hypothetical protein
MSATSLPNWTPVGPVSIPTSACSYQGASWLYAWDRQLHLGAARNKAPLTLLTLNLAQLLGNSVWRERVEIALDRGGGGEKGVDLVLPQRW